MSDFVTKDSGERQTFSTGMQRDSGQKDLRPDLVYGPMLIRWAELMGRGAAKYGERNWEKARTEEELARFKASAFRHFMQWFYGLNPEEDHAAAVFFNVSGVEHVKAQMVAAIPKSLRDFPAAWAEWQRGNKIDAIKEVRSQTGMGLRAAKEFCEASDFDPR